MPDRSVVFFHAHPDDESIFTGGTLRLLADNGVRTVVVIATMGEGGAGAGALEDLAAIRAAEAERACSLLGVSALHFLGYLDAGAVDDERTASQDRSAELHLTPVEHAASRLAEILRSERAEALVTYDDGGIYAHPDHLAVHRIGHEAARMAEVPVTYEATVDREYLHFVETHLVGAAVQWLLGPEAAAVINRAPLGVPSVLVTTTLDVRSVARWKRAAIAAHSSQIPTDSELHTMPAEVFDAVYGYEWFVRVGSPGPLDELAF